MLTPVFVFVPEAVLHNETTVALSRSASEKSAPVISAPLKKADTKLAPLKSTSRTDAFCSFSCVPNKYVADAPSSFAPWNYMNAYTTLESLYI